MTRILHHTNNPCGGDWAKTTCGLTHAAAGYCTTSFRAPTCPECRKTLDQGWCAKVEAQEGYWTARREGPFVQPLRRYKARLLVGGDVGTAFWLDGEPADLREGERILVSYVSEDQFCRFICRAP